MKEIKKIKFINLKKNTINGKVMKLESFLWIRNNWIKSTIQNPSKKIIINTKLNKKEKKSIESIMNESLKLRIKISKKTFKFKKKIKKILLT